VGCLTEILNKIHEIINDDRNQIYQDKVEACHLLTILGYNLDSVADLVNRYYWTDVMITITEACKNRIAKVQEAARAAKNVWEAVKSKGEELASAKQELEHLENLDPEGPLTPDDLIKVKSGYGHVADAKTLGYLKRKSRKRSKKAKESLEERRAKSKKMNKAKENCNSRMMNEKIFDMEQERANLMKQAERLKKRDDSIENLMGKYITKSGKKTKPVNRSNLLSKIKERMFNIEKGKSIEIIESKKCKEQRMKKRQQESIENEGGEEETKNDGKERPSQHDGEGEMDEEEDDGDIYDKGNEDGGNNEEGKQKGKFVCFTCLDATLEGNNINFEGDDYEGNENIPKESKFDTTFERDSDKGEMQKQDKSKGDVHPNDIKNQDIDYDDELERANFEKQIQKEHQQKSKTYQERDEPEIEEDNEFANVDYEEKLLAQHNAKSKSHKNREEISYEKINEIDKVEESMERKEFEKQLIEEHKNKARLKRTNEKENLIEMQYQPVEAPKKSQIIPPIKQSNKSEELEEKARREKDLKNLKQKREETKKKSNPNSSKFEVEDEEIRGEHATNQNSPQKETSFNPSQPNASKSTIKKPQNFANQEEYEKDHTQDYQDDHQQRTGRFRKDSEEEEYQRRRDRRYRDDQFGKHMFPPYTVYAPPVYPAPVYQVPANMYSSAFSPNVGFQTPQFEMNEMARNTFHKNTQFDSPERDEAIEKKLVFDVGTSPEAIDEKLNERIKQQQEATNKLLQASASEIARKSESPERAQMTEIEHPSFAASPSDKIDPQNRSSFIMLDPVTRAWVDALAYLDNEDYQSAYEIILSTGIYKSNI
jgi:hypothetical protein